MATWDDFKVVQPAQPAASTGGDDGWGAYKTVTPGAATEKKDAKEPAYKVPFQGLHDAPYTRPLEFPDAPTTGRMPLPGLALPLNDGKDTEGNEGLSVGGKAATLFGTLATASPKARQEIYLEHLPGATKHDDKYGNPGIDYKGKFYYTSRPGEFDAMDAGRLALGTAATLPAMAAAPVSVPGMAAVGALTGGAQSVLEDVGSKAAGRSGPWIDPAKAATSTAIGAILPPVMVKALIPFAGYLNSLRGGSLPDAAFQAMGIDASKLTPELRESITRAARRTFSQPEAVQAALRQGVAKEFNTDLTRGEALGNRGDLFIENKLAAPGSEKTADARQVLLDKRAAQDAQLSQAQSVLRAQPGQPPLSPNDAGTILKKGYADADEAAKANVNDLYDAAKSPFSLEALGLPTAAPATHVGQLGGVTKEALSQTGVGRTVLGEQGASLTPNATKAFQLVQDLSKSMPRATPTAGGALPSHVTSPAQSTYSPTGLLDALPPGATRTPVAINEPGAIIHQPAVPASPEAQLSATVNAPGPGAPRMMGPSPTGLSTSPAEVNWTKINDVRKQLTILEEQANKSGTATDAAAVREVVKSFDDHFGPLNPLLEPARAAHAERMSTFAPGGSDTQDKATTAALKALSGPEPGPAVVNTLFGNSVSKGEAVQMMDHLNSKVFPDNPEAQDAIKQMALRRLTTDAEGKTLSPQKMATAIEKAFSEREAPLYQRLFSGEDLAELRRFHELAKMMAESRSPMNPPNSGWLQRSVMELARAKNVAGLVGAGGGGLLGLGVGGLPGAATGAGIGGVIGSRIGEAAGAARPMAQAARAVNVPPNVMPPAARSVPGILGATGAVQGARDPAAANAAAAPSLLNQFWQGQGLPPPGGQ
jgi:hypothetical protein